MDELAPARELVGIFLSLSSQHKREMKELQIMLKRLRLGMERAHIEEAETAKMLASSNRRADEWQMNAKYYQSEYEKQCNRYDKQCVKMKALERRYWHLKTYTDSLLKNVEKLNRENAELRNEIEAIKLQHHSDSAYEYCSVCR